MKKQTYSLITAFLAALVLFAMPGVAGPFDISVGDEIQAGKEAASWIERNLPISKDPTFTAKIQSIGRRLAQAAERKDLQYEFHVIAQPDINAFALPGGYIYLYQGLIQNLPSDDALAFVIAHEMVHAAKRHWAGMMKKATALSVLSLGYADVLNLFLVPAYSRDAEREADSMAMRMIAKSGFNPQGAIQAMQKLLEIAGSGRKGLPIFRSHPTTDARLGYLKKMAEEFKLQANALPNDTSPSVMTGGSILDFSGIAQNALEFTNDFPLAEGNTWIYRFTNETGGVVRQTVKVAEKLPDLPGCFRIESQIDDNITISYAVAVIDSGVMRRAMAKGGLDEWELLYVLPSSKVMPPNYRVSPPEEVETPLGTFQASKVERLDSDGNPVRTAWFAPAIGLIKETSADGISKIIERFKPGRAVASN